MLPTRRLLLVLLAPALLLALGNLDATFLALALLALLAALGAVGLDWSLLVRPGTITVRRRHEPRLSLGADNLIQLDVANGGPRPLRFVLRDGTPPDCRASALYLAGSAPPGGSTTLRYTLRPLRRGDHQFGDAVLRWDGPLGLVRRQATVPLAEPVKVYPNLLELRKYDLLARRGRLQEAGLRAARRFGTGTEFESLREYQPDDDYRRINWKATARRGRPMTAEFETERSQNVLAVLDAGRLMATEVGGLTKLDHALNTSLMLAYVAALRGDRVGLLAFSDRVLAYLPPRRGRRAFLAMLATLYNLAPEPVEPDFDRAFQFLATRQMRRSLLVLFTDLTDRDASSALVRHLARLARQHLAVCVTLADPVVLAAATATPTTTAAVYERVVAARLLEERAEVLGALRQRGVITLDVPADRLTVAVVNKYLELKARTQL
ncbi:MAG TPA: DUF58 domain-containing protein [Chloroflexota bacterium]|nr:DUF58 domain-containing protein [Chloroflexota bacterium]